MLFCIFFFLSNVNTKGDVYIIQLLMRKYSYFDVSFIRGKKKTFSLTVKYR